MFIFKSIYICRWIAVTYFQPLGARTAFPCYDEPALKANVTIRMAQIVRHAWRRLFGYFEYARNKWQKVRDFLHVS